MSVAADQESVTLVGAFETTRRPPGLVGGVASVEGGGVGIRLIAIPRGKGSKGCL